MRNTIKTAVLALACSGTLAVGVPAGAMTANHADFGQAPDISHVSTAAEIDAWQHGRKEGHWRKYDDDDHDRHYYRGRPRYYGQPVRYNTRIWRGRDHRYYCQRDDGTTGLLIGAAVGGLVGNEVAGRGDKTLGVVLGAAGGALLGREIDRSNYRCR